MINIPFSKVKNVHNSTEPQIHLSYLWSICHRLQGRPPHESQGLRDICPNR